MFQGYIIPTILFIIIAVVSRFIPHPPNFTPLIAISLFAGSYLPNRFLAMAVPILALFLSDLVIGFHDLMVPIYITMAIISYWGSNLSSNRTPIRIAGYGISSSLFFFVVTNFFVWLSGIWSTNPLYPMTLEGLVQCYGMAIPFYHSQLAGDAFYTVLLFGIMYLVERSPLIQTRTFS